MTRVGVSTSSFAANMSVKQNAADSAFQYTLAVKAVTESFYVDDGLAGADSVEEAKNSCKASSLKQVLHCVSGIPMSLVPFNTSLSSCGILDQYT